MGKKKARRRGAKGGAAKAAGARKKARAPQSWHSVGAVEEQAGAKLQRESSLLRSDVYAYNTCMHDLSLSIYIYNHMKII